MKNLRSILKLYKPHRFTFLLIMTNTVVITLSEFVYPYLTRWVTQTVIYEPLDLAMKHIGVAAIILTALYLMSVITSRIHATALMMCDKIVFDVENKMFNHYEHLPFSYYDDNNVGEMMSVMDSDTSRLYDLLYCIPTEIMSIVINIIGCCIVFSDINLKLFCIFIPLVPIRLVYEYFIIKKLQVIFKENREISRKKFAFIEDCLNGIRTTASFSNQGRETDRFIDYNTKYLQSTARKWKWDWLHTLGSDTFSTVYYLFIHVYGIYLAVTGQMVISDLIIFYMYSYMFINPFEHIASMNRIIREGLVSWTKIQEMFALKSGANKTDEGLFTSLKGDIEFKDVTFQYSDASGDVVKGINLRVPQGQFVAIVGPSGSGKSTLAGLIARFYEVSSGSICIDGTDIRMLNVHSLRNQVGVLLQNTYLFHGTVKDNIAYGDPGASFERIQRAAELANASEFIEELPQKYDSRIGEKGVKLSGGQRQRIAIARLFLTDPRILVFDEATSSLDNASESAVQESMRAIAKGRTTLVIAHRLSTIKNADRIVYLSENGIEEDGTHDELMQKNGLYAKMYNQNQNILN